MSDVALLNALQFKLDEEIQTNSFGFEDSKQYLKLVKDLQQRDSERILLVGNQILKKNLGKLTLNELWTIREQVAQAALDTNTFPIARVLIKQIQNKFPNSARAQQLQVMYQEAKNPTDLGQQQNIVQMIQEIEEDGKEEQKEIFRRRKVAVQKSAGNLQNAILTLRDHIKVQWLDKTAWEELANLYLQLYMYKFAAYCFEELILLEPSNILYYIRYAEIVYTNASNVEDYIIAQTYFNKAVQLSEGSNGRCLYGLINSIVQVTTLQKNSTEASLFLVAAAGNKLKKLYQKSILLGSVEQYIKQNEDFVKSNIKKPKAVQGRKK